MDSINKFLASIALVACATFAGESMGQEAPSTGQEIQADMFLADPTIIREGDTYYMAGTQYTEHPGFTVYASNGLDNWKSTSSSLPNLAKGEKVYGTKGFWAPQFLKYDGKWYMFYTANEQVAVAVADSIDGTYVGAYGATPIDGTEKNIDPFLFVDDDGKAYLYHVRFDHGNFLWVGEFDFNSGHIVDGTLQRVFRNDQAWENTGSYPSDPIMEGPTVAKIDGTYYLFYSANHFMSKDYAVGYATASSPLGPWTKNPYNPIINSSVAGEKGSGHGDLFFGPDGDLKYVFHVHNSDSVVSPRKTRIISLRKLSDPTGQTPFRLVAEPESIVVPQEVP